MLAHTVILERREQHRHNAPPSRIDPSLYHDDEYARALAVESSLPRASMLPLEQIALESGPESNLQRKASRDTRQCAAINLRFCHVSGVFRRRQTRQSHRLAADFTHNTRKCGLASCQRTMASSTKPGAWGRTSVRVQRTGRRTHRVHPVKSLVVNRCRAARGGILGQSRENLRRSEQCQGKREC